jgi:superfamily II DNA or RNA helicase
MPLRQYRLDETKDAVTRVARLRRPQREAFDIVHTLVSKFDGDLGDMPHMQLSEKIRDLGYRVAYPPHFQIQLATGVGKTRLLGALANYLFQSRQTRNILVLAPRVTILDKLDRETSPASPKYLLIDSSLGPRVHLCLRGNIDAFEPSATGLNLFVLSPQSLIGESGRFSRESEYRGYSLREYLRDCSDLVVFADEAHHLGESEDAAWSAAVRELEPKLWIGLTATPLKASAELLYRYDLATCLRDGLYTKSVKIWVEQKPGEVTDEEWDRLAIQFGLRRLERKQAAIAAYRERYSEFPEIEPVLLICARDTDHANELEQLMRNQLALSAEEVLVTHSERKLSEKQIARLVAIDAPGNKIRVVINVFQLTEGWDVTNVYVVVPLRAMATFVGAVQSMGRGLRLPSGHRTGDPEVDALDVVCFGRATLNEIVEEATQSFADSADSSRNAPIDLLTAGTVADEAPIPTSHIEIRPSRALRIEFPMLERNFEATSLEFAVEARAVLASSVVAGVNLEDLERSTAEDHIDRPFEAVLQSASLRVLAKCNFLDPISDQPAVRDLIEKLLLSLGAQSAGSISLDPLRIAGFVADEIRRRHLTQVPIYTASDTRTVVEIAAFRWAVPQGKEAYLRRVRPALWSQSHYRLPFDGWSRSVYEAAAFETGGEYAVAAILDSDADVIWWMRNDPPRLRVATPFGFMEPDFLVATGTNGAVGAYILLEVKGGFLWDGVGSESRVKAQAAVNWTNALNRVAPQFPWSVVIVLDEDIKDAGTLGQLKNLSVAPDPSRE